MICPPLGFLGHQKRCSVYRARRLSLGHLTPGSHPTAEKSHMSCIQDLTCSGASQQRGPWYQLVFLWFLVLSLLLAIANPGSSKLFGDNRGAKVVPPMVEAQWDLLYTACCYGVWKEKGLKKQKDIGLAAVSLSNWLCDLDTLTAWAAGLPPYGAAHPFQPVVRYRVIANHPELRCFSLDYQGPWTPALGASVTPKGSDHRNTTSSQCRGRP